MLFGKNLLIDMLNFSLLKINCYCSNNNTKIFHLSRKKNSFCSNNNNLFLSDFTEIILEAVYFSFSSDLTETTGNTLQNTRKNCTRKYHFK